MSTPPDVNPDAWARGEAHAAEALELGLVEIESFVADLEAKGSIYDAAAIAAGRHLLERLEARRAT